MKLQEASSKIRTAQSRHEQALKKLKELDASSVISKARIRTLEGQQEQDQQKIKEQSEQITLNTNAHGTSLTLK